MHDGKSPGAPKGNRNALKHGRYTVAAIAERRRLSALLRTMRTLVAEIEWVLHQVRPFLTHSEGIPRIAGLEDLRSADFNPAWAAGPAARPPESRFGDP
jgi:hypothetical protein